MNPILESEKIGAYVLAAMQARHAGVEIVMEVTPFTAIMSEISVNGGDQDAVFVPDDYTYPHSQEDGAFGGVGVRRASLKKYETDERLRDYVYFGTTIITATQINGAMGSGNLPQAGHAFYDTPSMEDNIARNVYMENYMPDGSKAAALNNMVIPNQIFELFFIGKGWISFTPLWQFQFTGWRVKLK